MRRGRNSNSPGPSPPPPKTVLTCRWRRWEWEGSGGRLRPQHLDQLVPAAPPSAPTERAPRRESRPVQSRPAPSPTNRHSRRHACALSVRRPYRPLSKPRDPPFAVTKGRWHPIRVEATVGGSRKSNSQWQHRSEVRREKANPWKAARQPQQDPENWGQKSSMENSDSCQEGGR